jgi:hypothetical protein
MVHHADRITCAVNDCLSLLRRRSLIITDARLGSTGKPGSRTWWEPGIGCGRLCDVWGRRARDH